MGQGITCNDITGESVVVAAVGGGGVVVGRVHGVYTQPWHFSEFTP